MLNTIVYNSSMLRRALHPYGVLAAGHSRFTPQDPAITSRFNEHTLILTTDGVGEMIVGSQATRTQPVTLSWVDTSGDYRHRCAKDVKEWTYLWFSFEGYAVDQLYAQLSRRNQTHAFVKPDIIELFKLVLNEVTSNHPGRHIHLSALVGQTLLQFENSQCQQHGHNTLQHLAKTLSENLAEHWDTKAMAKAAGLSVSRLHTVFRDEFSMPPAAWLREQRINQAKRMLTESDLAITRIGELCGYSDPHHFSREFSKNAMLAPSKFRAEMRARMANC